MVNNTTTLVHLNLFLRLIGFWSGLNVAISWAASCWGREQTKRKKDIWRCWTPVGQKRIQVVSTTTEAQTIHQPGSVEEKKWSLVKAVRKMSSVKTSLRMISNEAEKHVNDQFCVCEWVGTVRRVKTNREPFFSKTCFPT